MKLNGIHKLSPEEFKELNDIMDPYSFENYCGACDNFQTDNCPFKDKVFIDTEYKKEFNCENFWD